jgi:hypothetical protein
MKTKITIKNFSRALVLALLLLLGYNAKAQTHVYNESTSSGMFFKEMVLRLAILYQMQCNSSANVAQSGTGWVIGSKYSTFLHLRQQLATNYFSRSIILAMQGQHK